MATVPVVPVYATRAAAGTSAGAGVSSQVGTLPATNVHTLANDGHTLLHVTATATTNLTFLVPANNYSDGATATKAVGPLAAGTYLVGPFPREIYGNTVTFVADVANATLRAFTY